MDALRQVFDQIDIRGGVAVWVLSAHLYAVLTPLVLCVAVYLNHDYLAQITDYPGLLYLAVGFMSAGGAFEVSQNNIDRWYLTPETASANGTSFCDFLFYWFGTLGQASIAIALAGSSWWVVAIAIATAVAFPFTYFSGVATFAPLSIIGLLGVFLAYLAFGDPIIFLQLLMTAATMYFFTVLLRTGNQNLHGFTTTASASGIWFLALAITNGAAGTQTSWITVAVIVAISIIGGFLLWPVLMRLQPTPRPFQEAATING
ncbi:MAG: hypothetical protein QNJ73_08415 [Gammaproteobacteria bacterium]|nr:hypothetical protein [Gammaproteobacteria bacterium]